MITAPQFASFMMFVLLWTGTLLHDFAEVCYSPGSEKAANKIVKSIAQSNAVLQSINVGSNDEEEHFHDAVVGLRDRLHLELGIVVLAHQVFQNFWQSKSDGIEASQLQRPPPLISLKLPTHTFMAKKALLI